MSMSLATAGVKTGLDKAKAGIADFSARSMEKLKSVATFFKTGLVIGAGFFVGMKKSIEKLTDMARAADRLGVSTEMFQRLAFAAKQTGVDTERLADAMKDLDVKLQDGIMRGGSFAELIEELGLDMGELAKMPAAERFLAFSDAIKNATGSLSRFGADEFGDAMYELLPLLEQGSAGILKMGDDAVIASDKQIAAAKRAQAVIDKTGSQFSMTASVWTAEVYQYFENMVVAATQTAIEIANNFKLLGKVIIAALNPATWATSGKAAYDELSKSAVGSLGRIKDAIHANIDEQIEGGQKVDAESSAMTAAEIARLKKSGDQRKKNADSWQKSIEKSAGLEQKAADEREKRELSAMSTQEKIIATQDKILKLRKEISATDPFEDKGQVERAEKELEVEQLLTEQAELQGTLAEEAVEAQTNKLDLELQLAKASGDPNRIAAAQKELDTETQIVALMKQHKISRDEASKILQDQNAHLDTQKDLELQLLNAQADGNDALARELQGRIDKEKEALAIMDEFGISIEKARVIAGKLAAINAGPDLNNSGFITPKEQRAFDKKQKALAKEEKKRQRAEIAAERNVSAEKRRGTGLAANAARNKELQEQRDIKKAGEQALKDWKKQGADAPKMFDLDGNPIPNGGGGGGIPGGQPLGPDGKPVGPGGNHVGPDGKMVGPNGEPLGPGGGGGGGGGPDGPKQPGGGNDPSLEKLDKIITELGSINKSLQC